MTQQPAALAAGLVKQLQALANPANVAGMARYGISSDGTLGVSMPQLRAMAKELRAQRRKDPEPVHQVALELWASGIHEARILAVLIDPPALVTRSQADAWVAELDSWDVCDQTQGLLAATDFAYAAARDWAEAEATFTKRAGFVLMATLAVHDKAAPDQQLIDFLPLIVQEATDDRNFVKKAINWALRQIGKRSLRCHGDAVATAEEILRVHPDSTAARWIARDALRELRRPTVLARVGADLQPVR